MRPLLAACGLIGLMFSSGLVAAAQPVTARGVVYDDANRNAVRDAGEVGLPNVRVSNGREIVLTDAGGGYELPIDEDTILFVVKPRGWMTPVNELNLPRFYYIHKPQGSPKLKYPGVAPTGPLPAAIDFPLHRQKEPERFNVLVFGDTQPRNIQEIEYLAHDVIEQVIGSEAAFGLSMGDLVFDRLDLFEPLNQAVAQIGFAFYNVLGNHDIDYLSPDDKHSDETFELHYGPSYYSFDYGAVHFIVLDDVMWHGKTDERKGRYTAGLGERQIEFVRNDLKLVSEDQLVVVSMHIPIVEIRERAELFRVLAGHPRVLSFSAHTHIQQHLFLGPDDGWPGAEPHHHVNFVTACGSWWSGAPDEVGIPHTTMRDGAPNGWAIVTFDGNKYSLEFRAARRPADYQMNIHAPQAVPAGKADQTEVLVNVFAGSERSTVDMRFSRGEWVRLERVSRVDPYYAALKQAEDSEPPPPGRQLPKGKPSTHLWRGVLPANPPRGTHLIEVRTTDMFGQTYTGRRIIRIE